MEHPTARLESAGESRQAEVIKAMKARGETILVKTLALS